MNRLHRRSTACALLLIAVMAGQSICFAQTAIDGFAPKLSETQRQREEQAELEHRAKELERQRDEKEHLSQRLMHRHHPFAYCVTFTQIAIALSAIAALTRRRPVWYASMVVGAAGVFFLIQGSALA